MHEATIDIGERFTDNSGRQWVVRIDGAAVYRISKELGIKFLDPVNGFLPAMADEASTIDILWACCRDQAKDIAMDVEGFARVLDDSVIADGRQALYRAYIGFFRDPTRRDAVGRLWSAIDRITERIEQTFRAAVRSVLTNATGQRSSGAPVSQVSGAPSGASD